MRRGAMALSNLTRQFVALSCKANALVTCMRSVTVSLVEPHPSHAVDLEVFVFRAEQIARIEKPEMVATMSTSHTALHKTVDSRASV